MSGILILEESALMASMRATWQIADSREQEEKSREEKAESRQYLYKLVRPDVPHLNRSVGTAWCHTGSIGMELHTVHDAAIGAKVSWMRDDGADKRRGEWGGRWDMCVQCIHNGRWSLNGGRIWEMKANG
jgi:hypothetical protein